MPQQKKKESSAPAVQPAAKAASASAAKAAAPAALVGQVARANYREGAALVAPANAPGYAAGKEAAKPKLPKVAAVAPSKEMLEHGTKTEQGHGTYTQTWAGGSTETEFKPKVAREKGESPEAAKPQLELLSGTATVGAGKRVGIGGEAKASGKYGEASIAGDIHAGVEAGANAKYKVGSDGVEASGNAAALSGIDASASGELATAKFLDQNLGIGAKGNAFAGARVGAGGQVGITKEFVGAKGQVGGFVGVEAGGEVHGNVGPIGAKAGASVQAGLGGSLDGEISYSHGKLKLSGKAAVALGVGASLTTSVELDIGTALHMGGKVAAAAARAADHSVDSVAASLGNAWGSVSHWFGL